MVNSNAPALPDDLIRPRDAARLLRCHVSMVYRAIQDGRLAAYRIAGSRYAVSEAAVLALVQQVRPKARVDWRPAGR